MKNKPFEWAKVLAFYALLTLVMRFLSFFPSVINHDESTYILIADAIRSGKMYLIDIVDTKPVGIFLIFGCLQTLFGTSILMIRIVTALWIVFTAFGLYRVHLQLRGEGQAPFASGLIYIVLTSIFTNYGVSPNTELFFNLFTILALELLLKPAQTTRFFLAGLLLGFGFIIKYVVLFDTLAFAGFFLWKALKEKWAWQQALSLAVACGLGFALPFASVFSFYWSHGFGQRFLFYTFEVSGNYFIDRPFIDFVKFVAESFGRYFFVSFFFFYSLLDRSLRLNEFKVLILLWSLSILYIILAPGKLFSHYFIQFMLPFSLMAGSFFDSRRVLKGILPKAFAPKTGYAILLLMVIANIIFQKKDYIDKPDYPTQIADYLDNKVNPEDVIYTGNYHQIIYHLLNEESPTPFIHRSLLWDEENVEALGLDQNQELKKIMKQHPKYVIYQGALPLDLEFGKTVKRQYQLVKRFPKQINIYERIDTHLGIKKKESKVPIRNIE